MQPFPKDKLTEIKKAIDRSLAAGSTPIAAFDADGTLWDTDLGENFFQYQIAKKLIPNLPGDPWAFYVDTQKVDVPKAYLWLAQINHNFSLQQVQEWARAAVHSLGPLPVFSGMKEIIQHLQSNGVKVYVVTASVKWAVEPGAEQLGIPVENVIGITTKVENGMVTEVQDGVITWREGKVTGLLSQTKRQKPFLSAGNTLGDLALLDSATDIRIVNAAAKSGHRLRETEETLVNIAKQRGWFYHVYRD